MRRAGQFQALDMFGQCPADRTPHKVIAAICQFFDTITQLAHDKGVISDAADHPIRPYATIKDVIPRSAEKLIIAASAPDNIMTANAEYSIITRKSFDHICFFSAGVAVFSSRANQKVSTPES